MKTPNSKFVVTAAASLILGVAPWAVAFTDLAAIEPATHPATLPAVDPAIRARDLDLVRKIAHVAGKRLRPEELAAKQELAGQLFAHWREGDITPLLLMSDPDPAVRMAAFLATQPYKIADMPPTAHADAEEAIQRAVPFIVEVIKTKPGLRFWAFRRLLDAGHDGALMVCRMLSDDDRSLSQAAMNGILSYRETFTPEQLDAVLAATPRLLRVSAQRNVESGPAIAVLSMLRQKYAPALMSAFRDAMRNDPTLAAEVRANVAGGQRTPELERTMIAVVACDPGQTQTVARVFRDRSGTDGRDRVLAALTADDGPIRKGAAVLLPLVVTEPTEEQLDRVLNIPEHDDAEVQKAAGLLVCQFGPEYFRKLVEASLTGTRDARARALERLSLAAKAPLPAELVGAMNGPDPKGATLREMIGNQSKKNLIAESELVRKMLITGDRQSQYSLSLYLLSPEHTNRVGPTIRAAAMKREWSLGPEGKQTPIAENEPPAAAAARLPWSPPNVGRGPNPQPLLAVERPDLSTGMADAAGYLAIFFIFLIGVAVAIRHTFKPDREAMPIMPRR